MGSRAASLSFVLGAKLFSKDSEYKSSCTPWPSKMGPICCPETSVMSTNIRCVTSQKTEDFSLVNFLLQNADTTAISVRSFI